MEHGPTSRRELLDWGDSIYIMVSSLLSHSECSSENRP